MSMPAAVQEIFDRLWQDISYLHLKWNFYRQLFGTSPDRIDTMNRVAPPLFNSLDHTMRHEVYLRICHLVDPKSMGKHANASLDRLVHEVESDDADTATSLKLRATHDALIDQTDKFKLLRDKMLAHADATQTASQLPGVSRQEVEEVLRTIRKLMDLVEWHYLGKTTRYDLFHVLGDGDSLIHALEEFLKTRDARLNGSG